ncbi:MAG: S16 family serine protease [archaeon]
MKKTFILLLILFCLPLATAQAYHMTLLTVSSDNNTRTGGTADVYLEMERGTGRIFIDSFPLSKIDTQIVTRFSNEVACDFLQRDCSKYDYFYTIRASSSIVGGPSAGAAMTVLTVAALEDLNLNESVTMTGTINSGGLIGSVGGTAEKIQAAQDAGLKKVLIPKWEFFENETNSSINISSYTIEIIGISTIEEALFHYTGKNYYMEDREIEVPKEYSDTMKYIASNLCNRTATLNASLPASLKQKNISLYNTTLGYINNSRNALEKQDYYSTASFCFSANLKLRTLEYQDKTHEELFDIKKQIQKAINITNVRLEKSFQLRTIGDLETFMVVKERLIEAQDFLNNLNETNLSYQDLAYAQERYYSAASWSEFYGVGGKEFILDEERLREGCVKKLSEAEERTNYVLFYFPSYFLEDTEKELDHAYKDYSNGEYALCMFKASKAKAEADALMTLLAIRTEDALKQVLKEKLTHIKHVILREQDKDVFPILGYSYYEYSNNLLEEQPYTALTFTEYALEMSNLDLYFPKKKTFSWPRIEMYVYYIFAGGLIIGFSIGALIKGKKKAKKNSKQNKPQRKKKKK